MIFPGIDPCSTQFSNAGSGSESVWARSAAAVLHAWNHVEANKTGGLFLTQLGRDTLVVVDGGLRWKRRIAPAVIEDELPSAVLQRIQVGIYGIQPAAHRVVGHFHIMVQVIGAEVPGRVLVNQIRAALRGEGVLQTFARGCAGNP